eukprot:gene7815-10617_t
MDNIYEDESDIAFSNTTTKSGRRKIKTSRYNFEFMANDEQKYLQQAIKISRKETKRIYKEAPMGPIFYPTIDEFKDPLKYISKIRPDAEKYGICKIVPPSEWNPPCKIDMNHPGQFPTKLQRINTLQQGVGFDDGKNYNIAQYKEMADQFYNDWIQKHYKNSVTNEIVLPTHEQLAHDYWNMVETNNQEVKVEYANDIDITKYTSGFYTLDDIQKSSPTKATIGEIEAKNEDNIINNTEEEMFTDKFYAKSGWNLNNIPTTKGSVLQFLKTPVNGVNIPWLYIGMLFTTFCWHTEDNYFNSINYSHFGEVKQWYGIPGESVKAFEKVSKDFLMGLFNESPDILHHMTTQISPSLLISNNVPVYRLEQEPKTFIVTFPKAYHSGFSYGFNVGEAVNFGTPHWLLAGGEAEENYRLVARGSIFSHHRLLFTLFQHRKEIVELNESDLAAEVHRVLNEEIQARRVLYSQGVRDISEISKLPPNTFDSMTKQVLDYDDHRCCIACKHVCLFSAVGCECNQSAVACIRHDHLLCKCSKNKKFMLIWASTELLMRMRDAAVGINY